MDNKLRILRSCGKRRDGRRVERSASWLQQTPIHLHARNLFPWVLRMFSLRKYPGNTRNRACEWLRFPDWLDHAQTARVITKERRLKRSELCKPRYLRNVNSRRNGTCKEDNITYTYIYTPLILFRVPTGLPSIFVTFLLLSTIILSFTRASHRSGTVSHKISITFSIEYDTESFVIIKIVAIATTMEY